MALTMFAVIPALGLIAGTTIAFGASQAIDLSISVSNPAFSPNGDGRKDATVITISSPQEALLSLEIRDINGQTVRSWTADAQPSTTRAISWEGLTDLGPTSSVPDGKYLAVASAASGGTTGTAQALVVKDTKAPTGSFRSVWPDPLTEQRDLVRFNFIAWDRSPFLKVDVSVRSRTRQFPSRDGIRVPHGEASVGWPPLYTDGDPLLPGLYTTRLKITDDAGNSIWIGPYRWRVHTPAQTKVWYRVPDAGRRVALTFDDCWNAAAWRRILDVLKARGLQATFFCNGRYVKLYPSLARRTIAEGQSIGSHSWSHPDLRSLSADQVRAQLDADRTAWWRVAGDTPTPYLRPTYGAYNTTVLTVAGQLGFARCVLWNVDTRDWETDSSAVIRQRAIAQSHPGSIVIMHALPQTAMALPRILDGLKAKNLLPSSLDQMFTAAGLRA